MLGLLLLFATQDACRISREFTVLTPAGHELAAVLDAPTTSRPVPTVILISGAGPSTRDHYTIANNGAWQTITNDLVRTGYGVLRFDEVGTGLSTGNYDATATTGTLADDVTVLVAALRKRPDVDSRKIVLLGWSEGAAIAGLVASRDPGLAALVLLAPPSWDGRRIMEHQNNWRALHDPAFQRLDSQTRATRFREFEAERMQEKWFRYFLDYDPLPPFRSVKAPVLALHGVEDQSVTVEQSRALISALRNSGNRDASLVELSGFTHYLTEPGSIEDPPPFSSQVLGLISGWLQKRIAPAIRQCKTP